MTRVPLADLQRQPEPIRGWAARHGNINVFRLLANAPNVFGGWTQMADDLFTSPTFEERMRELIVLRVAHLQASPYELLHHLGRARAAGLSDRQINAVAGGAPLDAAGLRREERTALEVTTELCTTHQLSDETFAAAHGMFGDEAFTELLMIIAFYYGLALVINAVDLDLDATARFEPGTP
ncbi:4-carboxymuconolactone decarboxylase [Mycobacterium saskatchewanense]|uniref:4-carboxy muconolactone decarboxylase n=1 Tax=Mycobacterium saskatchewanense TaxID=220927 RepID=A0AAJ3NKR8_9MYCO|nr:carboxymuconolactone decarboxylase family protein [Mycobacterium saskatchewanense]ORW64194.1 4-carboxy muconolactone decarboxylase [Mycobacterium saskatchewanense]BBX62099.1 4-carboxymuconolactone decarboxylase [Mycobacterium saskatchewanense]